MVIEQISREGVLKVSRENLGLSAADGPIDDPLLAALLRRAATILCPCSPATLINSVLDAVQYLVEDRIASEERLADLTDKLIVTGDLLELNQVTTDDPEVKGTWLFAAPPSFVVRADGTIFLLGLATDEVTPLPASLTANVVHEGVVRFLLPEASEDARSVLRDLGWLELPAAAWLKAPRPETAAQMREFMGRKLEEQPPSGAIAELSILDSSRDARYYSRRWVKPTDQTGHFVARRPRRTAHRCGDLRRSRTAHRPSSSIYPSRELAGAAATLPGISRWRSTLDWEGRRLTDDVTRRAAFSSTSFLPCRCGRHDVWRYSGTLFHRRIVSLPTDCRTAKRPPKKSSFGNGFG